MHRAALLAIRRPATAEKKVSDTIFQKKVSDTIFPELGKLVSGTDFRFEQQRLEREAAVGFDAEVGADVGRGLLLQRTDRFRVQL